MNEVKPIHGIYVLLVFVVILIASLIICVLM